ncbi:MULTISPECIES: hypothetical protein [unclassified Amycolatopsis]|uniref:hypothetical protein n=1 Tax=unclassified Amycolatopsis TaxID=2618356 RepID=UPI000262596A|nr:hypothetical protein [Amycolatopsis sp. ATCC 39116]
MDLVVDAPELRRYATSVLGGEGAGGGVVDYLRDGHALLRDVAIEAEQGVLQGGWGKTGQFQEGLLRFAREFAAKVTEFVNEEGDFIAFLDGLRERMLASADAYEGVEAQNVQSLSSIAKALNPE